MTTSTRPYLLRALYEWMLDNSFTPQILVNTASAEVKVPQRFIENDKITLNIAPNAVRDLEIGNDFLSFSARFAGKPEQILVPISQVLAVYARENGEGMVFPDDDVEAEKDRHNKDSEVKVSSGKPELKIVK